MYKFNRKLNTEKRLSICEEYIAGDTTYQLATKYNVYQGTIHTVLKRYNIKRRESRRSKKLNQEAFDTITEDSAYWVGYLMGDGGVHWHGNSARITLGLKHSDYEHLIKFRDFLGSTHSIHTYKASSSYKKDGFYSSISIPSKQLAASLAAFGVTPRKSKTACCTGLENNRDFWRGLVDADGSVFLTNDARYRPVISVAGAKPLMEQYASFVRTACQAKATVRPHSSIWSVRVNDKYAIVLSEVLYKNCKTALHRKEVAAQVIMLL